MSARSSLLKHAVRSYLDFQLIIKVMRTAIKKLISRLHATILFSGSSNNNKSKIYAVILITLRTCCIMQTISGEKVSFVLLMKHPSYINTLWQTDFEGQPSVLEKRFLSEAFVFSSGNKRKITVIIIYFAIDIFLTLQQQSMQHVR